MFQASYLPVFLIYKYTFFLYFIKENTNFMYQISTKKCFKMKKYTFKFTIFGNIRKQCTVEAQSPYGANIAFEKFLKDRIVIDSVEEESQEDEVLNDLKSIFGIK